MTQGGKSLIGRRGKGEAMEHEKTVGQHDESQMPMQAVPTASLEVIEAAFLFGILIKLLDDPASVD
ncbi:hypothetical protein KSC_020300 [Ktedonobacter sp. SOSP1-52]|nr:hypothetical protein KSC_020300 [Ktedonobacter sp. SOSP1-52]